jgi:hypothetical protein
MRIASFRILLGLVFACAVAGGVAFAQPQTTQTLSPDRVTFYTEPNFKGEALTVEAGASVETLDRLTRPSTQRPWTYAISSVRVEGAARATVFTGPGYSGERLEIAGDVADLYSVRRTSEPGATWDRAIASVTVTGPQRAVVTAPPPVPRYPEQSTTVYVVPTPATPPPPPPPVIVREVRPRMDRRTAEQIVHRAFREVLNRPADPEGLRTYRDRVMNEGWSERQVIAQLQRSSEARGVNADEAIRQAYREVLGREPDASGLASYRAKWRDGWTQGQIRDDLRRSQEGRQSHAKIAITRAYRELLGREPDAAGFANYERLMREKGFSEREVRESIMSGDEYRQRQRGKGR